MGSGFTDFTGPASTLRHGGGRKEGEGADREDGRELHGDSVEGCWAMVSVGSCLKLRFEYEVRS